MDIHNPYDEPERPESPGEQYVRFADELASFVRGIGGPRLNEDALAVLLADVFSWLKK